MDGFIKLPMGLRRVSMIYLIKATVSESSDSDIFKGSKESINTGYYDEKNASIV